MICVFFHRLTTRFLFFLSLIFCLIIGQITVFSQTTNLPLPNPQIHPLPAFLEQWQDSTDSGDYFDYIEVSPMGYLIWSTLPITIYVETPLNLDENSASDRRFQQWFNAVLTAIQEWNIYLPLVRITSPEKADIKILRENPPLGSTRDPETGQLLIPRARSAQTTYQFKVKDDRLIHQMTLQISPRLSEISTLSATRHELGHALGIWGHSPFENDALYFSQVPVSPSISLRDVNTLKRIYQQPTRLGWTILQLSY